MFLLFSWIGWEGMIGWIWTRLLSGNHGVRTARQWLNHVLPTVLVLLRWAAPHSIVKCWGTWIYTNLTWIFRIYLQNEFICWRPCYRKFKFEALLFLLSWLSVSEMTWGHYLLSNTLFLLLWIFLENTIIVEIDHLDTIKLSTVDWCPTRLQQIWSLCCRTLIISELNLLKWQFLLANFHYNILFE